MNTCVRAVIALMLMSFVIPEGGRAQTQHMCGGKEATIVGTEGPDVLRGTAGNDVIVGLGGDDVIRGLAGSDTLCGGDGDDELYAGTRSKPSSPELLLGGEGDDLLVGSPRRDFMYGEGGNDHLKTGAEDAVAEGGPGDDVYEGPLAHFTDAPGPVTVDLATGSATGEGTDTLIGVSEVKGSAFDDVLLGDEHRNHLGGGAGDDVIEGRGGDDRLTGGAGNDQLSGGAGDDSFEECCLFFEDGESLGDDILDGGPGADRVEYRDAREGSVRDDGGGGSLFVDLSEGVATGAGAGNDSLSSIEDVVGSHGVPNTLIGTDGDNLLVGGEDSDEIYGHGGDDSISLGESPEDGEDFADAGPGDDRIAPSACAPRADPCGTSVIDGGEGTDVLDFKNFLFAGNSRDPRGFVVDLLKGIYRPRIQDIFQSGGQGRVTGIEKVRGSPRDDILRGDHGPNRLAGREGDDILRGRRGNDILLGKFGLDTVFGGRGKDLCRAERTRACEV